MFTKPVGPHLSPQQARDLDDRFLGSRPLEYFRTRIASLLTHGAPIPELEAGVGADLLTALGTAELGELLQGTRRDRELQVCVDSFTLRHHAAESLVRLYHAVTVAEPDEGAPRCLWQAMVDGPRQIADLVAESREHLRAEHGKQTFWSLVLPPEAVAATGQELDALNDWASVAGRWLLHAMELLRRDDLSLDAAHNKVKHGLAVRAQDDEFWSFITRPPDEDMTLPIGAVTGDGAVPLVDTVSLSFLSRTGRHGGLELATVKAEPAILLAETWMLATVHGAMFHLAARRHFDGRDGHVLPTYPRLHRGPSPAQLLGKRLIGLRSPITKPRKGGGEPRPAALAWAHAVQELHVDYDGRRDPVTLVDDPT